MNAATHHHQPARQLTAILTTLAVVLVATACGSTSTNTQTAKPATTPAATSAGQSAMIAQANAICRQLNDEFDADKPANASIHEILRLAPHRATLETKTANELSKLSPPATLAHDWQQILKYRQALAHELTQLAHYAQTNNLTAIKRLATTKKHTHEKLHTLATQHQLAECSHTGEAA